MPETATYFRQRLTTPLGEMVCLAEEGGICLLQFEDAAHFPQQLARITAAAQGLVKDEPHPHIAQLQQELDAYFSGVSTSFSVPVRPLGTAFQQSVWQALRQIPFGETQSYRQQSEKLGNPLAIRAVAAANARNPVAIVVPCHRVIGSGGGLTGYAGGLWRKEKLLVLEGIEL